MIDFKQIKPLSIVSETKIVFLVIDGLGGLPDIETNKTELATAYTPNLDGLAERGICGLSDPIAPGITPGSGPGHLALFGYDPLKFTIGRGVLEALGIGVELSENDVAVRGNFCTVDDKGIITDRRAGRISTDRCRELCAILSQIRIDNVELFVWPVSGHRFALVMRGNELDAEIYDTDPQKTGLLPNKAIAIEKRAEPTADLVNEFVERARKALHTCRPANMILLRGFSRLPVIPSLKEIYQLNPAAIARYPMYKGLARLMGMKIYDADNSIAEEFKILAEYFDKHDFFFMHIKETDSAGEDGNFRKKVETIEEVDALIPQLLDMNPDVVVVTGDHSTPAALKSHSWHPVPCLLYSRWCRPDRVTEFSEMACVSGSLGRFPATDIIRLAMANALKLKKYGA